MDRNYMRADSVSNRLGDRVPDNAELHQEVSSVVLREVLGISGQSRLGPLQMNDFSSTFFIEWGYGTERQGVFVKIPKVEIEKRQVGMVTPADRSFATEEYGSLVRLSRDWKGDDLGVNFIKPLAFLSRYNAIVTQRAYAREFFGHFRHADLRGRGLGSGADDQARGCLNRLGRALARYHLVCGEEARFEVESTAQKIQGYLTRLKNLQVDRSLLSQIGKALEGLRGRRASTHLTNTIKGLDVRNILIDSESRLFLLDPGKSKKDFKEADLARFLVTCKILYWGSLWFFLRLTPHGAYERDFLQGYRGGAAADDWVLTLFTIKELLKHWLMAYQALALKRWPRPFKALLKRTYIDPFYRRQIGDQLRKLSQESGS
jgi:hypothetical protein